MQGLPRNFLLKLLWLEVTYFSTLSSFFAIVLPCRLDEAAPHSAKPRTIYIYMGEGKWLARFDYDAHGEGGGLYSGWKIFALEKFLKNLMFACLTWPAKMMSLLSSMSPSFKLLHRLLAAILVVHLQMAVAPCSRTAILDGLHILASDSFEDGCYLTIAITPIIDFPSFSYSDVSVR
ncbi:hypothetical protein Ancab_023942 [Ancistrocladus abbreviatus]